MNKGRIEAFSDGGLAIIKCHGSDSILFRAIGNDFKGKISPVLYLIAIGSCWIST